MEHALFIEDEKADRLVTEFSTEWRTAADKHYGYWKALRSKAAALVYFVYLLGA